jgi:hypothetical protein
LVTNVMLDYKILNNTTLGVRINVNLPCMLIVLLSCSLSQMYLKVVDKVRTVLGNWKVAK